MEVEEISSQRYTTDRFSEFYRPDFSHLRCNAQIEEPESDLESNSKKSVCMDNRSISIVTLSEDENTLVEDSLSHDTPVEDLKFNFNFDETKYASNKSYMQKSSFQENRYSVDSNYEENKNLNTNKEVYKENVLNESHNLFSNTKFKNMEAVSNSNKYKLNENVKTNHFNSKEYINSKFGDKNRNIKASAFNYQNKNNLSKEKNCSFSEDPMMEDLLKRIRTQRAALGEILKREGERVNQGK